jgi:hypothetical protein
LANFEPETLSQVLARLEKAGYTDGLRADQNGKLRVFPRDAVISPEDLVVEAIYRFEGDTNLDDEEIIFAVSCSKLGIKGTYIVAFGSQMDNFDANIVQHLQKKYQNIRG